MQRIVARLKDPGLPEGSFEADPRVSAPAAVDAMRRKHDLGEDAATLLTQLTVLPEPTEARVRRYNGWTSATYHAAASALRDRKLVTTGKYKGTERDMFVPGEIAFPQSPAAPLEENKLALYGLEPDAQDRLRAPYGVILPLRPLSELFSSAIDGKT
jgi:hypothetical protein